MQPKPNNHNSYVPGKPYAYKAAWDPTTISFRLMQVSSVLFAKCVKVWLLQSDRMTETKRTETEVEWKPMKFLML